MIKLNVKHTEIFVSNLETLVEGNLNSIFIEFSFSDEWDELSHSAVFVNGSKAVSVLLSSNTCAIPWEVLTPGELFISLRGVGDGGNFVLCSEDKSLGKVEKSHANDDAAAPEAASPGELDIIRAAIAEIKAGGSMGGENGKSAYEIALEKGFEGSEDQWLETLRGAAGHTPVKGLDYFTEADKAELVNCVVAALPTYNGGVS